MPIRKLKLEKLRLDAGTNVRSTVCDRTANEYGESAKAKAKIPPIIVFDTPDGLIVADGFHRITGMRQYKITEWDCDVRKGTIDDAIKFALGCNTTHGLRRTNADKRNAVLIALERFSKMSDRAISEMCSVSNTLVGEIRKEVEEETERDRIKRGEPEPDTEESKPELLTPPKRQGKDGKTYKVPPRKPVEIKPPETLDATGIKVPDEIVPFWDLTFEESNWILGLVSELRSRVKKAQDSNDPSFREINHSSAIAHLDDLYSDLKRLKPFAVCPECNGSQTASIKGGKQVTCSSCKGRGFVSEFFWKNCVPEEIKKITKRA